MPVSPPVVDSSTAPGRRVPGVWLIIGITLLAMNLRPAVVAVAPLTSRIRAATGLGAAAVSLLTTLPLICFGIFALLAPRLGRALGPERALAVAILALIGGIALRLIPGGGPLFAGSALAGAGIAYFVADRHMSAVEGSLGFLPRRFLVDDDDLAQARRLLRDAGLARELRDE